MLLSCGAVGLLPFFIFAASPTTDTCLLHEFEAHESSRSSSLLQIERQRKWSWWPFQKAERCTVTPEVQSLHLDELIAGAYYINLDRAVERRKFMDSQLADLESKTCIRCQRFAALDPLTDNWVQKTMDNDTDPAWHMWGGRNVASVSIYHNHLRLWRHIHQTIPHENSTRSRFVLIMEDDLNVDLSDLMALPRRLAGVPDDAQFVLLGWWKGKGLTAGQQFRTEDIVSQGVGDEVVLRAIGPKDLAGMSGYQVYGGTHAYLLRVQELPNLVKFLETAPQGYSMDGGTGFDAKSMRKYALHPPVLKLNSDLKKTSEHRKVDRLWRKQHGQPISSA